MCWAGISQPGWEAADAVKASGGPELCCLVSGPGYETWAAGETEAGMGVKKGDIRRDFWRGRTPEQSCETREELHEVTL